MSAWELAQINIALPAAPLTAAELAWFVEALVPVNAVADAAPGFRWRLQTEDGDATAIRAFGDDRLVVNMSVWESIEALGDFVYRSPAHTGVLRRRRESFVRLAEAEERLAHLRRHGPTPHAFTFRAAYPAPDLGGALRIDDEWRCNA